MEDEWMSKTEITKEQVFEIADNVRSLMDVHRRKTELYHDLLRHCLIHIKNPSNPNRKAQLIQAIETLLRRADETAKD
jgi:hypothetical protein